MSECDFPDLTALDIKNWAMVSTVAALNRMSNPKPSHYWLNTLFYYLYFLKSLTICL